MALARLALRNLQQRASTCQNSLLRPNLINNNTNNLVGENRGLGLLLQRFSSESKEVAVQSDEGSGGRKSRWKSLLPRRLRKPTLWRRRRDTHEYDHPLETFQASGLGNALIEAAENMNRLFENIVPFPTQIASPIQLIGKFKETKDAYKLRFEVPGLSKDDLKVTVKDGVLRIHGERKVEADDESDDEHWMSYGYYDTSLVLPDDAKDDDIKAELKDGVLNLVVPKTESHGKDVKEVKIH